MPSKNDLRSKYRNRYSFYIPDKNKKYTLSAVSILSLCFSNITCIVSINVDLLVILRTLPGNVILWSAGLAKICLTFDLRSDQR